MRRRPDRLTRLAQAIETAGERDRRLLDEGALVDRLRLRGAGELHATCRDFVNALNEKLSDPAVALDPEAFAGGAYRDGRNLFQINLRGRLLQIEFEATEELYSREDFRLPYILVGTIRSFNREFLERSTVDERAIYCCPEAGVPSWYYFDSRPTVAGGSTVIF